MIRRSSAIGLKFIAWLVASLVIVAAIVLWRLSSGPVSLTPLTPYVEDALTPEDGTLQVTVGETQIQLRDSGLELVVLDLRGVRPNGDPVFDLPEVEIDLSVRALVTQGLIAPVRLDARAPRLVLMRRADGSVALAGDRERATVDPEAQIDVRVLAGLFGPGAPDEPLTYLRRLEFSGGRLVLEDEITGRRLRAHEAELVLERRVDGLDARLDFVVDEADTDARVRATAALPDGAERVAFDVEITALDPAALREFVPQLPAELDGVDLSLGARISSEVTLGGELSAIRFDVTGEDGVVRLPGHLPGAVRIDALSAMGRVAGDFTSITVASLRLRTGRTTLTANGGVAWDDPGLRVGAHVRAQEVTSRDLERLWPPAVADTAREWVLENIAGATVPRGEVHIDLRPGDLEQEPLRADAVRGSFDAEGGTVRYFEDLPPLDDVDARATFTAQTMDFRITSGGYRDLRIEEGRVMITGIGIEGDYATQLEVDATIAGPVPTALALIDMPPFGFASELGIDPAATSGNSRTELDVGLPLYKEVEEEEVRIAADATLSDVAARGLMGEIDLESGDFSLSVDRERMTMNGDALVRGIPLDIEWRENFADDVEIDRRYRLSGFLDEANFGEIGLDAAPVPLSGGFGFDVTGVERGTVQEVEATLDLGALGVSVPQLDWRKRTGEPAELGLGVTIPEDGALSIDRFTFAGGALEAAGSLELARETMALRRLTLERFSYRNQEGSGRLVRSGETLDIEVRARSLELDPLLDAETDADIFGGDGDAAPPTPLVLSLRAGRLIYRGSTLTDVELTAERTESGWRSAEASARLPNGERFEAGLEPRPDAGVLSVTSPDASEVLSVFDQTQRVEGGRLDLQATITEQVPELAAEGTFKVEEFTLRNAPVLARLLTVASLDGIRSLLGGEGMFVDRLELPFAIADDVLTIEDGRFSGSQLGLTLNGKLYLATDRLDMRGTIVPIYTLNRVIGSIPLIGDFLAGSEGEGAFAFTFRVRGDLADPDISVNPLSVLAPGFIRELFGGIARGELEPPEVRPSDD